MLEVIIGLVFTYLLLSLLATTINELFASWRGWRGHFLEEGLKKILEYKDNNKVYAHFKKNALYQQLENNPKVLGRVSNAPSYLSSESFVNILFKTLRGEVTARELVLQLPPESKIRRVIDDLKDDSHDKLVVFKERAIALRTELNAILNNREDLESNVESFINTLPAGSQLQDVIWGYWKESNGKVDVFKVKVDVWYDELMNVLNGRPNIRNILNQIPPESRLRKVLDQLWEDSEQSVDIFRENVQGWYNELMQRASGWYKKHIQFFTFMLGLTMAIAFNADTFSIYERLASNSSARQEIVRMATDFVNTNGGINSSLVTPQSVDAITGKIDELVRHDIAEARNPLGLGWRTYSDQGGFLNQSIWDWLQRIAGWLVTALAISLGAPFWFDLLKKFVSVRGSGSLPAGSNSTKVVINTEGSNTRTITKTEK